MTPLLQCVAALLDLARRDVCRRSEAWRALAAVVRQRDVDLLSRELHVHAGDEDGCGAWQWRVSEFADWREHCRLAELLRVQDAGGVAGTDSSSPPAALCVVHNEARGG